jgi:hypothetical protein
MHRRRIIAAVTGIGVVVSATAMVLTGQKNSDFNFVPVAATYPPSIYPPNVPVLGDGSTAQGGIAPALLQNEHLEVPSNFPVGQWQVAGGTLSPPIGEAKFRTHCNYSHNLKEDPILYPGLPSAGHTHTYFGNTKADRNSTYFSLRTTGGSTCGGGQINRSAYWFPSVFKDNALGPGQTGIVKPDYAIVYYNVNTADISKITPIPRGLSYVFGFNPLDPTDNLQNGEIATANAQDPDDGFVNQAAYRYGGNGFGGWKCESGIGGSALYLRDANGNAALNCSTADRIGAVLGGPTCWDGRNLSSTNGRLHVRQVIRDANTGAGDLCPSGWYRIAQFELIIWFSHEGPADYKEWYLSSDRMPGHDQFLNGQSMHSDWFGAWDYSTMKDWMVHCNGTTIRGAVAPDPHSCVDTQFGNGFRGLVGETAPDNSRSPQLNLGTRWTTQGINRFAPMALE